MEVATLCFIADLSVNFLFVPDNFFCRKSHRNRFCRISCNDSIGFNIMGDYATGGNDGTPAYSNAGKNG